MRRRRTFALPLALGAILFGGGLSGHFLLVPPVMALQMVFVVGLAFFLATANVYFRDASHWVNAGLLAWMFVTPIFYPHDAYPPQFNLLLQANPLAHFVGVYHELVLNQRMPHIHQLLALPIIVLL